MYIIYIYIHTYIYIYIYTHICVYIYIGISVPRLLASKRGACRVGARTVTQWRVGDRGAERERDTDR